MVKTKTNKKGFTITELIIVIVVIGILASIGIVSYGGYKQRAARTAAESTAQQVKLKLGEYFTDKNRYPGSVADVTAYLTSIGSTTLSTDFTNITNGGGTYVATPQTPTACSTSGAVSCTSYTITVPKTYWNGGSSDTNVVVTP